MEGKVEIVLKPIAGAAQSAGGYRAYLKTGKGDALEFDDVVAEAIDRGFVIGMKPEAVKGVVRGVLQSMIARVMDDGRTRRIDDFFSVSMKVHGKFEDEHDDFDPERHKLALSLKQLNAFRPSFKNVTATNPDHKKQFRIYSIKADDENAKNHNVYWGRDIIIKGADFWLNNMMDVGVYMMIPSKWGIWIPGETVILSRSETELRVVWPKEFADEAYSSGSLEVYITRPIDPNNASKGNDSREIRATVHKPDEAK